MRTLATNTNPLLDAWTALNHRRSSHPQLGPWGDAPTEDIWKAADIIGCRSHLEKLAGSRGLNDNTITLIAPFQIREHACQQFAWAIPNNDALDAIATHGPVIDFGAGTGYWAALLAQRDIDVVAYDAYPPDQHGNHWHNKPGCDVFHPVTKAGPEIVAQHADRTLLLCWPPYAPNEDVAFTEPDDPDGWEPTDVFDDKTVWRRTNTNPDIAELALTTYHQAGGQTVVYVGEGPGGCTGGGRFHALLGDGCDHWRDEDLPCDCPDPQWQEVDHIAIPQWDGIHDSLTVYKRI